MINPNGEDFEQNIASTEPFGQTDVPTLPPATDTLRDRAGAAAERTQRFVRENPMPIIVGALAAGLAIGWALRYSMREEKEMELKTPVGDFNWSYLSLPFLWPFFRSMRERVQDSAETVGEAVRGGVRKIDIDRYSKPLRKRWRSWTR
jgi:hypothetical protein